MKIYIRMYKIKCPFMQIFALKIAEFFQDSLFRFAVAYGLFVIVMLLIFTLLTAILVFELNNIIKFIGLSDLIYYFNRGTLICFGKRNTIFIPPFIIA